MTEWSHVFCFDETVGNLIDETEPTANLANVGRSGEIPNGLHVLVRRLDPPMVILKPANFTISLANWNFSGESLSSGFPGHVSKIASVCFV